MQCVSFSHHYVSPLISYYCEKNIRVFYITRKRMATRPLISRWRMPSRTGGRDVRARRQGWAAVCRDMFVTRSLGLGVTGRGTGKIHVRRRTILAGRHGGVRAGVGVIVGCGSCAAYQRVDIKSRLAIIDSELRPEDLPLNSARLLYLCLQ